MDTYIRQKGMGFVHVDPSWPGKGFGSVPSGATKF